MKIKNYATLSYFVMSCCFLSVHIFFKVEICLISVTIKSYPLSTLLMVSGASLYISALFFLLFLLSVISFKYDIPKISIIQNETILIIINILGLMGIILSLMSGFLPFVEWSCTGIK